MGWLVQLAYFALLGLLVWYREQDTLRLRRQLREAKERARHAVALKGEAERVAADLKRQLLLANAEHVETLTKLEAFEQDVRLQEQIGGTVDMAVTYGNGRGPFGLSPLPKNGKSPRASRKAT